MEAVQQFVSLDARQFARFLGGFSGIFRGVNALLASVNGKDSSDNAMVAGGVASLAILFDEKSRRQNIALYLFVRAIDVYVKKLVRLGVLPYWSHFESFLFGVCNMPIMYGFLFDPSILQKGYYKWILSMGNVTDKGLDATLRARRLAQLEGKDIPLCPCSSGYHEGPCTPVSRYMTCV